MMTLRSKWQKQMAKSLGNMLGMIVLVAAFSIACSSTRQKISSSDSVNNCPFFLKEIDRGFSDQLFWTYPEKGSDGECKTFCVTDEYDFFVLRIYPEGNGSIDGKKFSSMDELTSVLGKLLDYGIINVDKDIVVILLHRDVSIGMAMVPVMYLDGKMDRVAVGMMGTVGSE